MLTIAVTLWIVVIEDIWGSEGVLIFSDSPSSHHVRLLSWSRHSSLLLLFFFLDCQLSQKLLSLDCLQLADLIGSTQLLADPLKIMVHLLHFCFCLLDLSL